MRRFKWSYILSILFLFLLVTSGACITVTAPERPTSEGSQSQDSTSSSQAKAKPIVHSFSASPGSIEPGEHSTLSWNVSGASTVKIDRGIGDIASLGSTSVAPPATTTYVLTASNASGSVTASTQVIVSGSPTPTPSLAVAAPDINFFTADSARITHGGSSLLSWKVYNADSVSINNGIGTVSLGDKKSVSPSVTTTYELTATNAYGVSTQTVQVTVIAKAIIPPSLKPVGKPDLVTINMGTTTYMETSTFPDRVVLKFTIRNQGSIDAGASVASIEAHDITPRMINVAPLAAGEEKHLNTLLSRDQFECVTGRVYPWSVELDLNNYIDEINEENNLSYSSFRCP